MTWTEKRSRIASPARGLALRLALGLAPLLAGGSLQAADALPPVTQRFAPADAAESPSFQKHVVPLFGRLGCNGRACHGSFQGRGGFRLSLFGYDFQADHDALFDRDEKEDKDARNAQNAKKDDAAAEPKSPRVVAGKADESLIVSKPTSEDEHEGGQRYNRGGWEHHLLQRWIESGAEYAGEQKLAGLEITPSEIVFQQAGAKAQLQVIAVWSDGAREDVTPLCRYQSNSDQVAAVDEDGMVVGNEPGDSHIVVFYDKAVVPIPVMRPVSELAGDKFPSIEAKTDVDRLVLTKLKKLGLVPSEVCDDSTFLRRMSLDLTGTLPSASEVEAFLADKSPDKRSRKIDELLESDAYAAWWTTKLCDFTGNNDDQLVNVSAVRGQASQEWYDWIFKRVQENAPYDQLVQGIVLANSRLPDQSYLEYCKMMSEMYRDNKEGFAEADGMPHYWARREFRNPPERAISFAYAFLGIRIQCAQCHKHPFDQWTKKDFEDFTGFFAYTRAYTNGATAEDREQYNKLVEELGLKDKRGNQLRRELPELLKSGKVVPFPEVATPRARPARSNQAARRPNRGGGAQPAEAKVLGGAEVALADYQDPREPLMNWLRDPENKLFSRALVNRLWANYFNVGIVEPADDMSLANPPSNAALLEHLANGFVREGYDLKWVHREILNSETYQRSWRPNDTNRLDERNFSRAVPRRLPAEIAYDALYTATASDQLAAKMRDELKGRAVAIPGASARTRGNNGPAYALTIFGRSTRESNCECDRSMDASLLQTVYLQNDRDTYDLLTRRGSWIDQMTIAIKGRSGQAARPGAGNGIPAARLAQFEKLREGAARRLAQLRKEPEANKDEIARIEKRLSQMERQVAQARKQRKAAAEPPKAEVASDAPSKVSNEKLVQQAYLRTLSRYPSAEEMERSQAFLKDSEGQLEGVRGLMWALINTKEFIVNH